MPERRHACTHTRNVKWCVKMKIVRVSQRHLASSSRVRHHSYMCTQGDVEGSLELFDAALTADPGMKPYLWQRGLSLYYLGSPDNPAPWEEGAMQFREDVAVNPADTEESIWAFMCEARLFGSAKARSQMLQVERDPRPVMRSAYSAFQEGRDPSAIALSIGPRPSPQDLFYTLLYQGLWHEAEGNEDAAKAAIVAAADSQYGKQSGDYMAALAKVHCRRRGWKKEAM
eukprot:jgi/Botrbrau1/16417/Bobra.0142s0016.2